ncbi:SGNH/GDSL hydrolase family protein [Streptomyces chattanoogensis]|uniref:Lipoprotein n=1 Tax=Streptomyces chattanoogensis TaxID=66876 RepID=A0A0N0XQN4_9ACTN|nr:SGNH/GDSL hydrolase family protein [Streptomyces chattanoogensis]KPC58794.1 lipoprotein [Streptomyces chattanoogensis]
MTHIDRPFRPRRHRSAGPVTRAAAAVCALVIPLAGCGGGSAGPHPGPSTKRPAAKAGPVWRTDPGSIAALGDSITVGFDACTVLSDCPEVSWATGTDPKVDSLARRLVRNPVTHSWNHARTGALMSELPDQIAAAARHRPELVTILIGANDACRSDVRAMTPTRTFRADFERALKKLRRVLPRTQVYVAAVPDLLRLWSEGRKNQLGKQVWKLGICGSMLRDPDDLTRSAERRREKVRDRVMAYNRALARVCRKDALCRFDGSVFDYRFTDRQLSTWDWFHPGMRGQRELAELAFRTITRVESRR